MGLAVLLSRSRGGAVILLGSLILVALMLSSKKRKHRSESLSSVAVWILIITSLGLSSWVGLDALLRRFDTLDIDMSTRTAIYRDSLPLIGENYISTTGKSFLLKYLKQKEKAYGEQKQKAGLMTS